MVKFAIFVSQNTAKTQQRQITAIFVPILTGNHDISLLIQHHNHGNHGCGMKLWQ